MFASVAQAAGSHGIGFVLTGMGTDGAKGLLALLHANAATIAPDEASCIVYGMPREAEANRCSPHVTAVCRHRGHSDRCGQLKNHGNSKMI